MSLKYFSMMSIIKKIIVRNAYSIVIFNFFPFQAVTYWTGIKLGKLDQLDPLTINEIFDVKRF